MAEMTLDELTFAPDGKSDDTLWREIQEACRLTTPAWRAYEEMRARYSETCDLRKRLEAAEKERDRVWCRALTNTLPSGDVERVTKDFNRIRPDAALEPVKAWLEPDAEYEAWNQ